MRLLRHRQPTSVLAGLALSVLFATLSSPLPAHAASTLASSPPPAALRLSLHVKLERQAPLPGAVERGRSRLRQHVALQATLQAMGVPMATNPLDPDDVRRRQSHAQRTQQRVQAALAGRPAAAHPAFDPAALQARAQQLMARCGTDSTCLMQNAAAMSAATVAAQAPAGGDAALQARLQAYGQAAAACEQQASAAAKRACQDRARRAAGGGDDAHDPSARDDDLPERFQLYTGSADCGLRISAAVDERSEGEFDDVQGRVPFTQTVQAKFDAPVPQSCPLLQAVLDIRTGRLWTRAVSLVPELASVHERQERGRGLQRQQGTLTVDWREADAALQLRLLNLDTAGQDWQRVPATGGGEAVWQVRWRFDPA